MKEGFCFVTYYVSLWQNWGNKICKQMIAERNCFEFISFELLACLHRTHVVSFVILWHTHLQGSQPASQLWISVTRLLRLVTLCSVRSVMTFRLRWSLQLSLTRSPHELLLSPIALVLPSSYMPRVYFILFFLFVFLTWICCLLHCFSPGKLARFCSLCTVVGLWRSDEWIVCSAASE